ncbi:hypothetical protein [Kaarinaea lacus]
MHGMGDWHWGFGFGHWFFGALIWIAVFVLVLWLFKTIVKDD